MTDEPLVYSGACSRCGGLFWTVAAHRAHMEICNRETRPTYTEVLQDEIQRLKARIAELERERAIERAEDYVS